MPTSTPDLTHYYGTIQPEMGQVVTAACGKTAVFDGWATTKEIAEKNFCGKCIPALKERTGAYGVLVTVKELVALAEADGPEALDLGFLNRLLAEAIVLYHKPV